MIEPIKEKLMAQMDEGDCLLKVTRAEHFALLGATRAQMEGWLWLSYSKEELKDGIIAYAWELPVCLEE